MFLSVSNFLIRETKKAANPTIKMVKTTTMQELRTSKNSPLFPTQTVYVSSEESGQSITRSQSFLI